MEFGGWVFGKALRATLGVGVGCVVLVIALVIIGGGLANVSQTPKATTPPLASGPTSTPPVAANKTWVVVKQWNGSGIKDTEKFTVGNEWRIDWDFTPGQYGGIIQVLIYSDAGALVGLAANTQKGGADTSFQHSAGTFYLSVNSANGDWKVAVQDFR